MKPITEHPYSPDLLTSDRYFWNCKTPEQLDTYYKKLAKRTDNDLPALLAIVQNEQKLCTMIRTTVVTMDGWCGEDKSCALASLVLAMKQKTICEIGVYAGRSFLPMAMAVQFLNHGKVIGIDPYSRDASAKDETTDNAKWWGELDHELIYQKFKDAVKRFRLEPQTEIIRKTSDNTEPFQCDMLHIDGNHSDQAMRDAERFGPKVGIGGIIVCDDIMWHGGGVLRAIDFLESIGFVEAFRQDGWNVLQRVK